MHPDLGGEAALAGDGQRLLTAVNYAGHRSQCYVRLPFPDLASSMAGSRT